MAADRPIMFSWTRVAIGAHKQTVYEQRVEDVNSLYKFNEFLDRRLIVLPLQPKLSSVRHGQMLGKEIYSDKCSLPRSIGGTLYEKMYEMPWTFEITKSKYQYKRSGELGDESIAPSAETVSEPLQVEENQVFASALDFRAPENYIFVPPWMMRAIGLKSMDIVDVRFLKLHPVSLVTLQPLSAEWDAVFEEEGDSSIQSLLENELNKYSTLTAGTTVVINIKGRELPLHVKETKSRGLGGREIAMRGVRIQDADMRTDIDRSRIPSTPKASEEAVPGMQRSAVAAASGSRRGEGLGRVLGKPGETRSGG